MKALVRERYGSPDVLHLEDVPEPVPGAGDVLVRVHAASINPYDWHFLRGTPLFARLTATGLLRPTYAILGSDAAGVVEAVGSSVTRFRPGDEVFGEVDHGGLAQYLITAEDRLGVKPRSLSFEQAAAVPLAGMTALQGLRDVGQLGPGQRAMIIGASGGVGTFAVQIAKAFGAHVTAVCSARNVELVRSIGADAVIDYTREDFTKTLHKLDVVFQLAGMHSAAQLRHSLTERGRLVLSSGDSPNRVLGPLGRIFAASLMNKFVKQTLVVLIAKPNAQDIKTLTDLFEASKLAPVIDRSYPLAEAADALRYLELGHARGKVVINVAG